MWLDDLSFRPVWATMSAKRCATANGAMAKYFLHVKVFSRGQGSRVTRAAAYRAGERTCSPPIRMASNATAAATDNQAPGAARLPVAWIRNVTIAGVDPPMVVARL